MFELINMHQFREVLLLYLQIQFISFSGGRTIQLPVYIRPRNVTKYIYQENLPSLSQITYCCWLNKKARKRVKSTLLSVSTPAKNNDLRIMLYSSDLLTFWVRNTQIAEIENSSFYNLTGWHKHCFTWSQRDNFKWYADLETSGDLKLVKSVPATADLTVTEGGRMIPLNDQDGFTEPLLNRYRITEGKIAWINLWDYAMDETEIQQLNCEAKGSIVNRETLSFEGKVEVLNEVFPCPGNELAEDQGISQQMTFCKIEGVPRNNSLISTHIVRSNLDCAFLCLLDEYCVLFHHNKSIGNCQLFNSQELDVNGHDLVYRTCA